MLIKLRNTSSFRGDLPDDLGELITKKSGTVLGIPTAGLAAIDRY